MGSGLRGALKQDDSRLRDIDGARLAGAWTILILQGVQVRWTCVREIPSIAGAICSLRSFECQQTSPHSGLREGPSGRQRRQFWTPARTDARVPCRVSGERARANVVWFFVLRLFLGQPPVLLYGRVYGWYSDYSAVLVDIVHPLFMMTAENTEISVFSCG